MGTRYIQDPESGELIPAEQYVRPSQNLHFVMDDIKPYQSPLNGQMVTSRSQHRELMRRHGVIEVGNERLDKHIKPPEYRKGDLRGQLKHAMRKL